MPVLAHGKHVYPTQGTCLLEYIAVLQGEPFSDHPECVDSYLADIGRSVNDFMSADGRDKLLTLVPRMVGTSVKELTKGQRLRLSLYGRDYVAREQAKYLSTGEKPDTDDRLYAYMEAVITKFEEITS